MQKPPLGWCTPCTVDRVIDGDTLDVWVKRLIRVRLRDCWAPETRTLDLVEKAAGIAARDKLGEIVGQWLGSNLTLLVPTGAGQEIAEVMTFGRVLGRLWLPDGKEVSAEMVEFGQATATKKPPPIPGSS